MHAKIYPLKVVPAKISATKVKGQTFMCKTENVVLQKKTWLHNLFFCNEIPNWTMSKKEKTELKDKIQELTEQNDLHTK